MTHIIPTVLYKSNANDYRCLSRFVLPIYHRYIVHFLDTLRTINRRDIGALLQYLVPTINRFNDTSFRRYIAQTIYRSACKTSSRYIASVKYRSSDLSLNQECSLRYIVLVMYRLSEFSHGEKCLSSISRSSEIIISFFRFLPHFVLVYVSC